MNIVVIIVTIILLLLFGFLFFVEIRGLIKDIKKRKNKKRTTIENEPIDNDIVE